MSPRSEDMGVKKGEDPGGEMGCRLGLLPKALFGVSGTLCTTSRVTEEVTWWWWWWRGQPELSL